MSFGIFGSFLLWCVDVSNNSTLFGLDAPILTLFLIIIWIAVYVTSAYISSSVNFSQKDQIVNSVLSKKQTRTTIQSTWSIDSQSPKKIIFEPISNALSRITKKYFWIKVSPWHSPVSPEKFTWYHTWVDFETTLDEQDTEVPIYAICTWSILMERLATWYWWVIVQKCNIDNEEVTVIYGHINIKSIVFKVKDVVSFGKKIAFLGKWYTSETWWERKHLHLWIHKWNTINIKWYVSTKKELDEWIDSQKYL